MRKLKPIPELQHLTPSQLDTLASWLEEHPYSKVVQLVSEQFGIKISRDKLYRHYHRQKSLDQFQDHLELAQQIAELKLGVQASRTEELCHDLILQKVFDLLLQPDHTPETLKHLAQITLYERKQALAERRQRLAEHKAGLKPQPVPVQPQFRNPPPPVVMPAPAAPPQPTSPIPVAQTQTEPAPAQDPEPAQGRGGKPTEEILRDALAAGMTLEEIASTLRITCTPEHLARLAAIAAAPTPRETRAI